MKTVFLIACLVGLTGIIFGQVFGYGKGKNKIKNVIVEISAGVFIVSGLVVCFMSKF